MRSPILNRQLTLEDAYRVPDNAGGYTTQWQALGQHWALIRPGVGRERAVNALTLSRVILRIIIRAAPIESPMRPHAGQRFREGSRIYAITAVTERDRTGRYLVCHAEEEVAT